jgi:hypothetical protein
MNNNWAEVDFHKLPDEKLKLTIGKAHNLIHDAIIIHIWPKLCTVKEITIPDAIPESEFNKLLADICNMFSQIGPAFSEELKLTIKELVIEELRSTGNYLTNHLFKKAKSIGEIPADIKIFKTKIIINKSKVNELIENFTLPLEPHNKNSLTKIKRIAAGILALNTKEQKRRLKNDLKRDAFGKTSNDYYINAEKMLDSFRYEDLQMLYGTIHFIKETNDQIKELSPDKIEHFKIKKLTSYSYEFPLQLNNKFFGFFCKPDRKIGKNTEATNYQTYTKKEY